LPIYILQSKVNVSDVCLKVTPVRVAFNKKYTSVDSTSLCSVYSSAGSGSKRFKNNAKQQKIF
jgi:hypothetical protein